MFGLIPAAGLATRMGGIPKFAIPLPPKIETLGLGGAPIEPRPRSLLEYHIAIHETLADEVIVATRPENAYLVARALETRPARLVILETATMAETVLELHGFLRQEEYFLTMPDTYFTHGLVDPRHTAVDYSLMASTWSVSPSQIGSVGQISSTSDGRISAHADKLNGCSYPSVWGAMFFKTSYLSCVRVEDAHIGIGLNRALEDGLPLIESKNKGSYIDCGTPDGYASLFAGQ